MKSTVLPLFTQALLAVASLFAASGQLAPAHASEFSVTPIRVELKAGALNETITVTNHSTERLRVSVKLMAWSQDAAGTDVYEDTADLVYFPRQLDLDPDSKRLIRVGAKAPGATTERTYRLFIEEQPEPAPGASRAQVAVYFKFGVPVFVPPAVPKPVPEVANPTLDKGKLSVVVRNTGNQHFRLTRVGVTDGAGFSHDVQGWYSLANTTRSYAVDIPRDVCRRARSLDVVLEGEGIRVERKLHVDAASCP